MENITTEQLEVLLLTKAMSDNIGRVERWTCLDDVVDELLMDGAIDREEYLTSIMELTQLGLISSDIKSEEDIEMSETVGFDIIGLTTEGLEYIEKLKLNTEFNEKVTVFFDKFSKVCGEVSENGAVKLLGMAILPLLSLLV